MTFSAIVQNDGTLTARLPKYFSGRRVKIIVQQEEENASNWSEIAAVLKEADCLEIPRRSITNILEYIHTFETSKRSSLCL